MIIYNQVDKYFPFSEKKLKNAEKRECTFYHHVLQHLHVVLLKRMHRHPQHHWHFFILILSFITRQSIETHGIISHF